VVRTRVGYAGGTTPDPIYSNLGDHSETIQIDYDPTQISYEELLDVFWAGHSPTARPWSRQYASLIFYHNDEQKRLAIESRDREAAKGKDLIFTELLPFTEFHLAEAYHQKYRLQQVPELVSELQTLYPDDGGWINSTAAARVNGYVGGYGTSAMLLAELDSLGLSPAGSERLLEIVSANER